MEERLEVAEILIKYNKLDMALEQLEDLKQDYKDLKEVYLMISEVYEKKELLDQSLKELKKVELLYPEDGEISFKIAVIYQKKKEIEKCFEYLNIAIHNGFDSKKIFFYKGLVLEDLEEIEEALNLYNKALKKDITYMAPKYRKYSIYMKLNRYEEAEEVLNEMILYNAEDYDGYNLMYLLKLNQHEYSTAFHTLTKALEIFGDTEPLTLDLIRYYILMKDFKSAEDLIITINSDNPYYTDFIVEKAKILTLKGEYTTALEILNEEDVYDEENIQLTHLLAQLNFRYGNYIDVINLVNKASEFIDMENPYGRIVLILKGYSLLNEKMDIDAQEHFKGIYKILKIQSLSNPYDVNLLLLRALILIELEEYTNCEILLDAVVKIDEDKYGNIVTTYKKLIEVNKEKLLNDKNYILIDILDN